MSAIRNTLRGIVPLLVLVAAIVGARMLIASKPVAEKKPRVDRGLLVEARTVSRGDHRAQVQAQGTVVAAYSIDLSPEIAGRVVWQNPELTIGGLVRKGEVLVKLDPSDYRIDVAQQEASVARAQADVELERGRKNVAEAEWRMFGSGGEGTGAALAQRDPQMRSAKLGLDSASQGLGRAKLRLARTILRAPFDAVVRENLTEVGRMVSPGQRLATLVDTTVFMVAVALPVEDLQWLKVPGTNVPLMTAKQIERARRAEDRVAAFSELSTIARVTQKVGDGEIARDGVVTRLLGELDPVGRMARLLVAINDPLGRDRGEAPEGVAGLPLLLGSYVHVGLAGGLVPGTVRLPRDALRDGNHVYVIAPDNTLDIRQVDIARKQGSEVLVSSGLTGGERIVTSAMPSAVQGMKLRVVGSGDGEGRAAPTETVEVPAELPAQVPAQAKAKALPGAAAEPSDG